MTKIVTDLGNKIKAYKTKNFRLFGVTVVLTAMMSVVIFTSNYSINAQMMGDHGDWVGNMTFGVKDHQQKMIINGTINLEQTIFEAISSNINTSLTQAMSTAEQSVGNDSFALAAFGSEDGGYFTYRIILGTPGMKFYNIIVDPGNGQILTTQEVSQKELEKMHQEHSAAVVRGNGNDGGSVSGFPFLIPH